MPATAPLEAKLNIGFCDVPVLRIFPKVPVAVNTPVFVIVSPTLNNPVEKVRVFSLLLKIFQSVVVSKPLAILEASGKLNV